MLAITILAVAVLGFVSLNWLQNKMGQVYEIKSQEIVLAEFTNRGVTDIQIIDARDHHDLPFNPNEFRIGFNRGMPLINEYYYLVRYTDSSNHTDEVWVNIGLLFGREAWLVDKKT